MDRIEKVDNKLKLFWNIVEVEFYPISRADEGVGQWITIKDLFYL
jgi:hypothetical protein